MKLKFKYKSHEIRRRRPSTKYIWREWYDSTVPMFGTVGRDWTIKFERYTFAPTTESIRRSENVQ